MDKVILFDFFGVISSEVSPIFFKRYFNEEDAKIIKEEIMSKGDKGELSEEEIYDVISKRVNVTPLKVKEDFKECRQAATGIEWLLKNIFSRFKAEVI